MTIAVHALPALWGSPSPSPFAIKLLTWLRMVELPYELVPLRRPPASPTGKIPYVVLPDGRRLHDSGLVIEALACEHDLDLDADRPASERAIAHAVRRMLEEHLYFIGLADRFIGEGWAHTAAGYFGHLPIGPRWIVPGVVRRRALRNLHGQGMGRHPRSVRLALAQADLAALAQLVGDHEHLFSTASTVDATLVGFLWAFSANPFPSVVGSALAEHPSLVAYLDRMRDRYWAGWPEASGIPAPRR